MHWMSEFGSGDDRTRTCDQGLMSPLLYQLSYVTSWLNFITSPREEGFRVHSWIEAERSAWATALPSAHPSMDLPSLAA